MKNLLYCLHREWSLFMALLTLRLQFFKETLPGSFPRQWQYVLDLPNKDRATFFPYIVSVEGVLVDLENRRLSLGWRKRTVKDPVNIIAYGLGPKEFIRLLQQTNPKWERFLGSSYFLYGPVNCGWHASVAIKLDIDKHSCERHHIRLFGLKTARGEKITIGAAHHDWANHTEAGAPASWNETRDLVASDLAASNLGTLCGLSEKVTDLNWKGAEGDGKILIIKIK